MDAAGRVIVAIRADLAGELAARAAAQGRNVADILRDNGATGLVAVAIANDAARALLESEAHAPALRAALVDALGTTTWYQLAPIGTWWWFEVAPTIAAETVAETARDVGDLAGSRAIAAIAGALVALYLLR